MIDCLCCVLVGWLEQIGWIETEYSYNDRLHVLCLLVGWLAQIDWIETEYSYNDRLHVLCPSWLARTA